MPFLMPGTLSSSFAYTSDARITKSPHTLQFAISTLAQFFNSSLSYAHIPFTNYWNTAFHMLMTQFSETPAGFYSTISFEQSFFPQPPSSHLRKSSHGTERY